MVGVPRSSGCQLCRSRRVKCDEARPGCGNCRRYGAECPGYQRGLKFVEGKHRTRRRERLPHREGSSSSIANATASSSSSGSGRSTGRSSPSDASATLVPEELAGRVTPLLISPSTNRAQFIGTIIETIRPRFSNEDMTGMFSWLQPEKLGHRALLDGAICSVAMQLFGKDVSDAQAVAHSRTLYVQSLGELQAALRHPVEWRSSETLCAAILLCVFELFAGTASPDAWLQHARGIGILMGQRGPSAHAQGWDAAMVLSFRGILIMSDMFFPIGDRCFLSKPQWKPIVRDNGRCLIHSPETPIEAVQVVDDFFECLAEVPAVLTKGFTLRERNRSGQTMDLDTITELTQAAVDVRSKFQRWHDESGIWGVMREEVMSKDPTSLYASVIQFPTPGIGSMYMGYWASMLILQETLVQCGWPEDLSESQREYVQNIMRSIEYVSQGPMGPYRMGYGIRVVYDFASVEAQHWIRAKLDSVKKTYAATDKASYPEPRIDAGGYV